MDYRFIFAGMLILFVLFMWLLCIIYDKMTIKVGVVEAYSDEFYEEYAQAKKLLQNHIAGKNSKWAYDKSYYYELGDYGVTSVQQFEYYKANEIAYKIIGDVLDKKRTLSKEETIEIVKVLKLS